MAIAVLKAVLYPYESCSIPKGLFEQGELTVEDCGQEPNCYPSPELGCGRGRLPKAAATPPEG